MEELTLTDADAPGIKNLLAFSNLNFFIQIQGPQVALQFDCHRMLFLTWRNQRDIYADPCRSVDSDRIDTIEDNPHL